MNPKTKFIKMFKNLPKKARRELVLNPYSNNPVSLNVVYLEVINNTELGKNCLNALGYIKYKKEWTMSALNVGKIRGIN